jgi:hypothetical protein
MKVSEIYLVVAGVLLALSTIRDRKKTRAALITSGKVTLQVLPVLSSSSCSWALSKPS